MLLRDELVVEVFVISNTFKILVPKANGALFVEVSLKPFSKCTLGSLEFQQVSLSQNIPGYLILQSLQPPHQL